MQEIESCLERNRNVASLMQNLKEDLEEGLEKDVAKLKTKKRYRR